MHTDNDCFEPGIDGPMDGGDETKEKSLRWLLEMDLSEPEEKLFTVSGEEYRDEGLSAYEAEVAGRPLVRGNATSDDLATYVSEEIVISSDTQRSDIYTDDIEEQEDEMSVAGEAMAVDYSRRQLVDNLPDEAVVTDGTDILGLAEADDMGEKFLSIKRVKPEPVETTAEPVVAVNTDQAAAVQAETPVPVVPEAANLQPQDSVTTGETCSGDNDAAEVPGDTCSLLGEVDDDLQSPSLKDEAADETAFDAVNEKDLGGEQEQPESALIDRDSPAAVNLSEAPVPYFVAQPGSYDVANEDPLQEEDGANTASVAASVLDYVATKELPVDDEAFDQYLVGGEHLPDNNPDPDELAVQCTQGIVSVDPSSDVDIDYHEDFRAMDGFESSSVSAITSVISSVMEEIARGARGRMEELGYTEDAVEVDVMLGSDPDSIKRCYAEGFEPVTAVCAEMPIALQGLATSERDAIYVRLFHGQTNEN